MFSLTRITGAVVVAVGPLVAVAPGTAGLASAQPVDPQFVQETDDFFMAQLEANGIAVMARDEAIGFAHSVCDAIAGGHATPDGVAAALADSTALVHDSETKVFVYHSIEAYCAQYMDMVD